MENKQLAIQVKSRIVARKSDLKRLKKQNFVPGIVYGSKQKNITLSLDIRVLEKYSKREYENKIFTFESDDKSLNGLKVIKKAVTFHPTMRKPTHVDFLSLDMSAKLKVNVELKFEGKPKGVREQSGIFNPILRTIEVECLPADIPTHISIDVDDLALNENLHVSDLHIPAKLKLITKEEQTLCAVVEVKEEEVAKAPVTEGAETAEDATATTESATATATTPQAGDKKETSKPVATDSNKKSTDSK